MAKIKKIKLTDLHVNTENYRFEPVTSQKEAIDKMILDQGDKLFHLAEHIMANGLNPNDKVQVVTSSHDDSKFNVVEGNRRTIVLKLLNNPDIIDSERFTQLKKKFRMLSSEKKTSLIKTLECIVYDNPPEAEKWIKLKHAGQLDGVGTVTWTAQQIHRFEEKVEGKSSIALQTLNFLEKSSEVPVEIKAKLKVLPISNLERLISDPNVRDFLGVEIKNGILQSEIYENEVIRGLTYIVKDLIDANFNVKRIYTKEDREDYLRKIPKNQSPDKNRKSAETWLFNGKVINPPKAKDKPSPQNRDVLIPKTCVLTINNAKVNALYYELKKLSISKFTNVGAISFRAFVEQSLDCYIEGNGLKQRKDGRPLSIESTLITKITEVANDLEVKGLADKLICKGIRSASSNQNDLLGIDTLHAYVHNAKFSAIPTNMIITWDNIQVFIESVWSNIKM